jgi:hypothetical protein
MRDGTNGIRQNGQSGMREVLEGERALRQGEQRTWPALIRGVSSRSNETIKKVRYVPQGRAYGGRDIVYSSKQMSQVDPVAIVSMALGFQSGEWPAANQSSGVQRKFFDVSLFCVQAAHFKHRAQRMAPASLR